MDATLGQRRVTMILWTVFAAMALLLSVVGIYGEIAYSVARRTQEMGIQRTLGAQEGDILQLVLSQGLALTVAVVALGLSAAFLLTRVMFKLLYRVGATDPETFVVIGVLFVFVALAACLMPAYRVARVDPAVALRLG